MTRHNRGWIVGLALLGVVLTGVLFGFGGVPGAGFGGFTGDRTPGARVVPDARPGGTAGAGAVQATSAPSARAADALRGWDRRRARAYATGDIRALSRLYVPGAPAGAADVALLRGYTRRGFTVAGMRMQLLALAVLDEAPDRWRLRVTDRLRTAVAVGHGTRVALPRDQASTRVVTLHRTARGRWRVESVLE